MHCACPQTRNKYSTCELRLPAKPTDTSTTIASTTNEGVEAQSTIYGRERKTMNVETRHDATGIHYKGKVENLG